MLYIADSGNHRIVYYEGWPVSDGQLSDGIIGKTVWTDGSSGTTDSSFDTPWGITVDNSNNLWVGDF